MRRSERLYLDADGPAPAGWLLMRHPWQARLYLRIFGADVGEVSVPAVDAGELVPWLRATGYEGAIVVRGAAHE